MKTKTLTILAAALLAIPAGATALIGNTADLTFTVDAESSGLHAVGNGRFTFNTPTNGTIIGLSDLTDFTLNIGETFAYGWGVPGASDVVTNYPLTLDNLETFSFDTSNEDTLRLTALIQNWVGSSSMYNELRIIPGNDTNGLFLYPEVAFIGNGYGLGDPSAPDGATAPEPAYCAVVGLLLAGFGIRRKRLNAF